MSTLAVAALAVVAAVLGALAGMAYQKSRRRARSSRPAETSALPDGRGQPLKLENQRLRLELEALRRENAELQHLHRPQPATPPPARVPKKRPAQPAPAAAPPPVETAAVGELPAPAPLRYASAVPGGYLADAQLAAQPMGRMPLAVHPDPHDAARATFTLSPAVDKSWLIEAGLDRLRDYFDYVPPAGWPSTVAATEAGHLVREGEGWRVAPNGKGQLDVR